MNDLVDVLLETIMFTFYIAGFLPKYITLNRSRSLNDVILQILNLAFSHHSLAPKISFIFK